MALVVPYAPAQDRPPYDRSLYRHWIKVEGTCRDVRAVVLIRDAEPAAREGVGAVIAERDKPFADYSQGPPEEQPDPAHVIHPPRR